MNNKVTLESLDKKIDKRYWDGYLDIIFVITMLFLVLYNIDNEEIFYIIGFVGSFLFWIINFIISASKKDKGIEK